jgi:MYXO-CTERM domain-containing protein
VGVVSAVLCLLLAAPPARADWDAGYMVPAFPRSVEVWGPGTFSVSTLSQAHLFVEGRGTLLTDGGLAAVRSLDGDSAGTYLTPEGCFVSVLTNGGTRVSNLPDGGTGCAPSGTILANPAGTPRVWSVKHVPDGGSFAVASSVPAPTTNTVLLSSPQGVLSGSSWTSNVNRTGPQQPTGTLGVARVSDKEYAVFGLHSGSTAVLQGGSSTSPGISLEPPIQGGRVLAVELFSTGQAVPQALIGTTTGLYRGPFDADGGTLTLVQLPDAGGREVSGVDLNVEAGSEYGVGFGMAILMGQDREHFVLRAQPVREPSQVGTLWRITAKLPLFPQSTDLEHVACHGAQTCVAAAKRSPDGGTLFLYTNAHAPEFAMDASVELDEGSAVAFSLKAQDGDEDPVLMSVTPENQQGPGWSMERLNPGVPGDTVELLFTTGNVCTTQEVGSFVAAASDGWKAHDQVRPVKVFVRHTQVLPMPRVEPSSPVAVAGQGEVEVRADTPNALCTPQGWRWQLLSPSTQLQLKVDGGTALFTPPENLCVAGGETYTYQVIAYDSAGDSQPTLFSVKVEPWGRPNAPLAPDAGPVLLNAGQSHTLRAESTHVCDTASGFPGLETTWSLEGDGGVPAGITFRNVANTQVPLPATTPELTVETQDCVEAQLPLRVVHRMRDDTNLEGPASKVAVSVRTQLIPFSQGQLLLNVTQPVASEVTGQVATDLNCIARRDLSAELRLVRKTDGVVVDQKTVPVPGPWSLRLPAVCAGGDFLVQGTLVDASGARAGTASHPLDLPALPVVLEPLPEGTRLVAQCGQGARTTVAQTYPADSCPLSQVTWTWKDGPRLTWDSITGSQVELATQETGLAELVGRSVKLEVKGLAASGEEKTEEREVPITTEPFMQLLHRAEIPTASDTGLVGFSATLTNTTECGVQEVSLTEQLEGLAYVEESARLDGVPVAAEWADGRLTVSGLSVGPLASAQLTYVVRPLLLGERRVRGQAFLRGIPISLPEVTSPEVPDSGCGCTSGTPGPMLFALGALALAVRRRRARATGRS